MTGIVYLVFALTALWLGGPGPGAGSKRPCLSSRHCSGASIGSVLESFLRKAVEHPPQRPVMHVRFGTVSVSLSCSPQKKDDDWTSSVAVGSCPVAEHHVSLASARGCIALQIQCKRQVSRIFHRFCFFCSAHRWHLWGSVAVLFSDWQSGIRC